MGGKLGVVETKQLLDVVLTGVDIVRKAGADGAINFADLGLLLSLVPVVGPGLDGADRIPAELADLDAADATEVVSYVMAKLSINDAHAVEVIDSALKVLLSVWTLVNTIKASPLPAA